MDNGWIESLSARWVGDGKAKRAWGPPMESLNWIFLSCLAHFSVVLIFYLFLIKSCADTTNATIYPCDELWLVVSLYKNISLLIITHYIIWTNCDIYRVTLCSTKLILFFKGIYVKKPYNFKGVYGSNRPRFALNPSLNLVIAGWKGGQSLPTDQYQIINWSGHWFSILELSSYRLDISMREQRVHVSRNDNRQREFWPLWLDLNFNGHILTLIG